MTYKGKQCLQTEDGIAEGQKVLVLSDVLKPLHYLQNHLLLESLLHE